MLTRDRVSNDKQFYIELGTHDVSAGATVIPGIARDTRSKMETKLAKMAIINWRHLLNDYFLSHELIISTNLLRALK